MLGATIAHAQTPTTQPFDARVETLVRESGIDPRDVGIRLEDQRLMLGNPARSWFVDRLMREPLRADAFARTLASNLSEAASQTPARVLHQMSYLNSSVLFRGLGGDPSLKYQSAAKKPDALPEVLLRLGASAKDATNTDTLPPTLKQAAAIILNASLDAVDWLDRSQAISDETYWDQLEAKLKQPLRTGPEEEKWELDNPDPDFDLEHKRSLANFSTNLALVAAQDLVYATQAAVNLMKNDASLITWRGSLKIETQFGLVIFAGAGKDTHNYTRPVLLLIDVGGNDVYGRIGANYDRFYPVSIAVDLSGHDVYRAASDDISSFGAGVMGVGLLWDVQGDDTYDGPRRSCGAGLFGVGVLVDGGGDDIYRSVDSAQGWGMAGLGLLLDFEGRDRYESYRMSQGAAGPAGVGLLMDRGGDDVFLADDKDIRYPSPQSKEHNVSLSQGAGTGWRADYSDGVSVAGGVGVLYDEHGNDQYTCGVFGQGAGYWLGGGLLIDNEGDDRYRGYWYVQGAAAHNALGVLLDRAGKDSYVASANMSQGAGHDLSVGVFVDEAGDDEYEGTTLGLGASNAAGIGVFIDAGGSDRYRAPRETCLGWFLPSEGYRSLFPAYGLFFDLGGSDSYYGKDGVAATRGEARDAQQWKSPGSDAASRTVGFGVDLP